MRYDLEDHPLHPEADSLRNSRDEAERHLPWLLVRLGGLLVPFPSFASVCLYVRSAFGLRLLAFALRLAVGSESTGVSAGDHR